MRIERTVVDPLPVALDAQSTAWPAGRRIRPEVQALRAIAVAFVALHHYWPGYIAGGYIGVDVFFVISGFLITGMLLREAELHGRIRFGAFWLRRVRRLLPSALVVVATVATATWLCVPRELWQQYFDDLIASTFQWQNWRQASLSLDSGLWAGIDATPVQHFWSLSLEEQFYLVWPLVVLAGVLLARRAPRRRRRLVLAALFSAIAVPSLVYCVVTTQSEFALAYFSSFARAWEFAAGALLALAPGILDRLGERSRALVSWAGLTVIVASGFLITDPTVFPGAIALVPALATVAVIAAGMPRGRWGSARLLSWRPVQWFGDVSYPFYLWHWPVLLLLPFITGVPTPSWIMAFLLVVSALLAWATKAYLEDPIRGIRASARKSGVPAAPRPVRGYAIVATLAVAILASSGAGRLVALHGLPESEQACDRFVP